MSFFLLEIARHTAERSDASGRERSEAPENRPERYPKNRMVTATAFLL
jgi:hypothetical protein